MSDNPAVRSAIESLRVIGEEEVLMLHTCISSISCTRRQSQYLWLCFQRDMEVTKLAKRFLIALDSKGEDVRLDPVAQLNKVNEEWEEKQQRKLKFISNQKFNKVRQLALIQKGIGVSLTEFNDTELWKRLGILDSLPHSPTIDKILKRQRAWWSPRELETDNDGVDRVFRVSKEN